MRVAALTLDYPPRRFIGSELATHQMLKALQMAGHRVEVYTTTRGAPFVHDGIPVTPTLTAFRKAAADVWLTHYELVSRVRGRSPVVGITHNAREGAVETVGSGVWSLLVHNADATADLLAENRRVPHVVVHPPVDWRDYVTQRTGNAVTLVNVTGEKGSDTFYELARRMPDRQFIGVIGGWGEPDIRDLPNVEIVQHTEDMRDVYRRTRVLLMPSEHEAWGRVAVEAMSSGIPVLATDLPGPRECIGDGGVLVELDWVDEYERQLNLLDDPGSYKAMSRRAKARAKQLDPRAELAAFVAAVEQLAPEAEPTPAVEVLDQLRWVHTSGRTVTLPEGAPQVAAMDRRRGWERQ